MVKLEEYSEPRKQVIYRGQRFNNRKQILFDARYKNVTRASRLHSSEAGSSENTHRILNRIYCILTYEALLGSTLKYQLCYGVEHFIRPHC